MILGIINFTKDFNLSGILLIGDSKVNSLVELTLNWFKFNSVLLRGGIRQKGKSIVDISFL